ncbi:DUF3107 domain-containing protein [Glaciibacter flavus]|uniref:DUF3107 domain-containing protein n=1 Tax=Orlajensenia flava TaxID=2565934 RepID=A0A4S4FYW1_9MICO|nr:DUF3107 domain-containing protein [Glaciibacter flavus]THG36279.1 DUF3107 domain-containing protein [Glaciibacter flavus]
MEIRIGIQNSPREISFETSQSAADVEKLVASAISGEGYLKLGDDKGNLYLVPSATLAYVEVGSEESRRVGFFA